MSAKCPNCLSKFVKKQSGSTYECRACGEIFEIDGKKEDLNEDINEGIKNFHLDDKKEEIEKNKGLEKIENSEEDIYSKGFFFYILKSFLNKISFVIAILLAFILINLVLYLLSRLLTLFLENLGIPSKKFPISEIFYFILEKSFILLFRVLKFVYDLYIGIYISLYHYITDNIYTFLFIASIILIIIYSISIVISKYFKTSITREFFGLSSIFFTVLFLPIVLIIYIASTVDGSNNRSSNYNWSGGDSCDGGSCGDGGDGGNGG